MVDTKLRAYARVVASNLVERYDGNAEVAREVAKRLVDEGVRLSNVFQSDELDTMVVEELEVRAPYALWGAR